MQCASSTTSRPVASASRGQLLVAEPRVVQPLGADEQQVDLVGRQRRGHRRPLVGVGGVHRHGAQPGPAGRRDLVAHQREQRRHDQRRPAAPRPAPGRSRRSRPPTCPSRCAARRAPVPVLDQRRDRLELAVAELGVLAADQPAAAPGPRRRAPWWARLGAVAGGGGAGGAVAASVGFVMVTPPYAASPTPPRRSSTGVDRRAPPRDVATAVASRPGGGGGSVVSHADEPGSPLVPHGRGPRWTRPPCPSSAGALLARGPRRLAPARAAPHDLRRKRSRAAPDRHRPPRRLLRCRTTRTPARPRSRCSSAGSGSTWGDGSVELDAGGHLVIPQERHGLLALTDAVVLLTAAKV